MDGWLGYNRAKISMCIESGVKVGILYDSDADGDDSAIVSIHDHKFKIYDKELINGLVSVLGMPEVDARGI